MKRNTSFTVAILNQKNMISWMRRRGLAYYNDPVDLTGKNRTFDNSISLNIPELEVDMNGIQTDSNLYIELFWIDFDSYEILKANSLIEGPDDYEEPEAYNVYRSFDDINYVKIGTVRSSYTTYRILKSKPLANFVDQSSQLTPGEEVWYGIKPKYNGYEGNMTKLGSVVPMDQFNIELKSPEHNSMDVSVNPVFKWGPDKELVSDSDVVYAYNLFVYDWNQSNNGLFVPVSDTSTEPFGYTFATLGKEDVSVEFTGNVEKDGLNWHVINPYGIFVSGDNSLYKSDKLENGKSYNWGINIAYAISIDDDSESYSISADFRYRDKGWGVDPYPYGMEPDLHADFTTETLN
jgi:hypothetical protein